MLNKDKVKSVRINARLMKELEKLGLTPQKILDDKLAELFEVEVTVKLKEQKGTK